MSAPSAQQPSAGGKLGADARESSSNPSAKERVTNSSTAKDGGGDSKISSTAGGDNVSGNNSSGNTTIKPETHAAGDEKHGTVRQVLRLLELITLFNWVCGVIHSGQLLMALLYFVNQNYFYACMTYTKQQFVIVLALITQWFMPTTLRVSGDKSVEGQIASTKHGRLVTSFPERIVLMANHQIYTEWLYLWWIAYTSGQHGSLYIILKESLKYIPVFGWAMQLYGFVFMARNWAKDQERLRYRLRKLSNQAHSGPLSGKGRLDPMWLLIFPEGTNLSRNTRKRSKAWAEKQGIADLEHLLLPRSTGLLFCLQELQGTVDWIYDCTIAYEGIQRGEYAQDLFTLRSTFLAGRPPKSVNMHWRRISVAEVPLHSADQFNEWVQAQWRVKEDLIEHFAVHGRFPSAAGVGYVETGVRLNSLWEVGHIFGGWFVFACVVAGATLVAKMLF